MDKGRWNIKDVENGANAVSNSARASLFACFKAAAVQGLARRKSKETKFQLPGASSEKTAQTRLCQRDKESHIKDVI